MNKKSKSLFYLLVFSGCIFFAILLMQPLEIHLLMDDIALLFPKGIIALKERNLLFIIQALMLLVIIPVYILTFIFSWRYRADNKKARYDPDLVDHYVAEVIWWGLPLVLVLIIAWITWIKTYELDPYKPIPSTKETLRVEVVALQWKWLFIYPEEKIATVNYLQIPVGRPVHFEITADAPMNSFWIPRLGGQIYAMPGMKTELYLMADQPGSFQGVSANISGEGFAGMHFVTQAVLEEEFQKWVASVKQSPKTFTSKNYTSLAAPSSNNFVELYQLTEEGIFHQILMKYMMPQKEK